eukprot:GHVO01044626.1.p1 GENE.GHVO01044626.1~~GHVO01044626.1.p1  ORF type:complete len:768 (-),score=146.52 GHVO01044626.1:116-2419(-)
MLGSDAQRVYYTNDQQDTDFSSIEDLTVPKFRTAIKTFIESFSIAGSLVYKERIRALGGCETLAVANNVTEGLGTKIPPQSICLDLEHFNMKTWTNDSNLSQNIGDDDGASTQYEDNASQDGHMACVTDALLNAIRKQPLRYLPVAEGVLKEVYNEMYPTSTGRSASLQIELHSKAQPTKIRDLKALDVESLVTLPGIIIQACRPQHKASCMKIRCRDCKTEKTIKLPPWKQSVDLPRICDSQKGPDEPKCSLDPYAVLSDESDYCDIQQLKFQELPEDVPIGDMPRHIVLNAANSLCGRVTPGQRINVVGVFSAYERQQGGDRSGKSEGVRSSYLHVLGFEQRHTHSIGTTNAWTYQEEEEFRKMSQDPEIYEKLGKSIAPAIYGMDEVKKSIACLLFGGARKQLADKTRLRGDINILLLGDPSTAKSQFLKFVEKVAPIAVYTSGKGSSAAGLTAAIIRDSSGNFALEGGAMVLADGGVVCIDEFDKMRDDDRVAIHEAMEQQTISIAKAGITTVLKTMCSMLAAANPSFGSYDDTKETTEQHDFETTILSRFDLIWLVRDEKNIQKDTTIAHHVFALHSGQDTSTADGPVGVDKLKQYIKYCRQRCSPRLSAAAAKKLENYYVEVRDNCRKDSRKQRDQIPITVRQLESLARLAESLARMTLTREVSVQHVEEAIRLFQLSTIETSKTAIARENLTPQERELIKAVEEVILQRLPINGRATKSTVMRDLVIRGYDAGHVGRAMRVLIQRGVLQEKGDASVRRIQ